jgi:hypothetical protein
MVRLASIRISADIASRNASLSLRSAAFKSLGDIASSPANPPPAIVAGENHFPKWHKFPISRRFPGRPPACLRNGIFRPPTGIAAFAADCDNHATPFPVRHSISFPFIMGKGSAFAKHEPRANKDTISNN